MDSVATRSSFLAGEKAELTRTFTQQDVEAFAALSGDVNPVHLDEAYAAGTRFRGRIIHGMLVSSLISAVLGTQLPGPGAIYLSQQLSFRAPARVGLPLTARVTVTEWDGTRGRLLLSTEVVDNAGTQLIAGEAKLVMAAFLK
jgi:acyl dehydratase